MSLKTETDPSNPLIRWTAECDNPSCPTDAYRDSVHPQHVEPHLVTKDQIDRYVAEMASRKGFSHRDGSFMCDTCYKSSRKGNRPTWDEYFMGIAHMAATRATCNRKLVGCVIVRERYVLATGYNGSIVGLDDCDTKGHLMEEGHCISGSTIISKYQTGSYNSGHKTVEEIYKAWTNKSKNNGAIKRMKIRAMAPTGLIVPASIRDIWQTGVKQTITITTFLGRSVQLTTDHNVYTPKGWQPINQLIVGDKIALNGQLAEQNADWLAERYLAGATIVSLANAINRSRNYVKSRLLAKGIQLREFKLGGWNKELIREKSHSYKGRNVKATGARARARRYALLDDCVVCGTTGFQNLQVHHIDGDPLNDKDENLTTLCVTCHNIAHTQHTKTKTVKFDKIVNIAINSEEMTYDLSVDGYENFIGNGIVLHNCVRTVHAEQNAIAQAAKRGQSIDGATMYITAFPCWNCAKLMLNAGIARIVYDEAYRPDEKVSRSTAEKDVLLVQVSPRK